MSQSPKIWQPLHPSVRPLLDPQYVQFHDKYMQFIKPDQFKSWDGSARTTPSLPYGGSEPVPVGAVEDVQLQHCQARVFSPLAEPPEAGYPVFLWFHGGGWAIGGLASENDFCAYICRVNECLVVSVDYRLAPEHPYPSALEDAIEALVWLHSEQADRFHRDRSRVSVGGTSAGGNLSAALVMLASDLNIPYNPIFQLLIVPVIDNTADIDKAWKQTCAPWLTPERMMWYRRMYMPDSTQWVDWRASPNLSPSHIMARTPPTWIAVAEQDLLATEALDFADRLRHTGVEAVTKLYEGSTHSLLALNGVLDKGKQLMQDSATALSSALKNAK